MKSSAELGKWVTKFLAGHMLVVVPIFALLAMRIAPADLLGAFFVLLIPPVVGSALLYYAPSRKENPRTFSAVLSGIVFMYLAFWILVLIRLAGRFGMIDSNLRSLLIVVGFLTATLASFQIFIKAKKRSSVLDRKTDAA